MSIYPCIITGVICFAGGFFVPSEKIMKSVVKKINEIFGTGIKYNEEDVTEEEILSMVNEGHEKGVLEANEAEMISNIFELGDKEAQDVMQHRINVVALDGALPLDEALDFMLQENKSRYPVYLEDADNILGIIHVRDAFFIHKLGKYGHIPLKDIDELVRPCIFVPETKNIHSLLRKMQNEKQQMSVVIDEYGQMSGIVTLEDILEEIVGEIMDENDEEETDITKISEDSFVMDGMATLSDVEEALDIQIPEEFDTLNGLLISKLEHIPKESESSTVIYQGYEFCVLSMDNKKIGSIRVRKLPEEEVEETVAVQTQA